MLIFINGRYCPLNQTVNFIISPVYAKQNIVIHFKGKLTVSALIQRAKSEEVGCQPPEPLDSPIGCVLAVDHSDWRCASESARCVGGLEYCVCLFFYALDFIISCFHVAPPRMCTLLWSWQHVETVHSMQLSCRTGETRQQSAWI